MLRGELEERPVWRMDESFSKLFGTLVNVFCPLYSSGFKDIEIKIRDGLIAERKGEAHGRGGIQILQRYTYYYLLVCIMLKHDCAPENLCFDPIAHEFSNATGILGPAHIIRMEKVREVNPTWPWCLAWVIRTTVWV